ncbi:MAG: cytochrome-c peroxidase [Chitinophagales bacterium]|nr:MAG: cytochrome-c peroxidase [Chitinophagales bacterium]
MRLVAYFGGILIITLYSFNTLHPKTDYIHCYEATISALLQEEHELVAFLQTTDSLSSEEIARIGKKIAQCRLKLKAADFWLRYLDPLGYKKINGPLPVEWESEVYRKWDKPTRREAAGFTLAELHLNEDHVSRDTLLRLIGQAAEATALFLADSITEPLHSYHHFFFANRLFLMNLAAIYTTGFECPDPERVIPELRQLLASVSEICKCFDKSFPAQALPQSYHLLYDTMMIFVRNQPDDFTRFDHFTFIRDYVNPLFAMNQQLIRKHGAVSRSINDYVLNNEATSIFDKSLFTIQYPKGIFSLVEDSAVLEEMDRAGKLLFYDPILSGNNQRSCASCHKPFQYFTDTTVRTPLQYDSINRLPRNAPSLVNVIYNHLVMLDGRHFSLQEQAREVITNPTELAGTEKEIMEKIMSCREYRTLFKRLLRYTPGEKTVNLKHIVSAITFYYSKFSRYYSPFDEAMLNNTEIDARVQNGFNVFMSKGQCATCHFVPLFNGVKPPFNNSEFEVIGVPADTFYSKVSPDSGRYQAVPVPEMLHAFRTTTLRNTQFTGPYMHNGVFSSLEQVIDFYDGGGALGRKLPLPHQTLSADSLHLTPEEKEDLILFMHALTEKVRFEAPPASLPESSNRALNTRKPGGLY